MTAFAETNTPFPFAEVFGPENGIGARSAIGVSSLPFNIPVEIEAVLAIV